MSQMIPTDNSVNEIYMNRVFLGDIRIFNEAEVLNKLEFSHILTVELVPVPLTITSRFPHIAILQVSRTNKKLTRDAIPRMIYLNIALKCKYKF